MSLDRQEVVNRIERERTDDAFKIVEPTRDPRIAPRVIPLLIAILLGIVVIVLFYVAPWG